MSALTTPSGSQEKGHFNQAGIGSSGHEGDVEKLKRLALPTPGHLEVHQSEESKKQTGSASVRCV